MCITAESPLVWQISSEGFGGRELTSRGHYMPEQTFSNVQTFSSSTCYSWLKAGVGGAGCCGDEENPHKFENL